MFDRPIGVVATVRDEWNKSFSGFDALPGDGGVCGFSCASVLDSAKAMNRDDLIECMPGGPPEEREQDRSVLNNFVNILE